MNLKVETGEGCYKAENLSRIRQYYFHNTFNIVTIPPAPKSAGHRQVARGLRRLTAGPWVQKRKEKNIRVEQKRNLNNINT